MALMDFIGGAAGAGADMLQDQRKVDATNTAAKSLADYNSELDMKRARMVEEMKNAPLNRLQQRAQTFAGQDVPVEAAPVTDVSGTDAQGGKFGFKGSIDQMRQDIQKMPNDEYRAEATAQLERQIGVDTGRAQGLIAGQTRKRTNSEALQAASDDAKVNDLPAYAAYEAQIGKPMRDERRTDVAETKADNQNAISNRRLDIQQQFNENRAARQDRMAGIQEARAGRMEDRQGLQMDKEELRSTRLSLTSVLTDISKEADRIQVLRSTAMDPAQTALYDKQLETLRKDQTTARGRLNELAGIEPSATVEKPEPSVKYDAQGRAYVRGADGKAVLKSEADKAARPAAGKTESPKPQPSTKAAKPDNPPSTRNLYVEQMAEAKKGSDAKQATRQAQAEARKREQAEEDARVEERNKEYAARTGRRLLAPETQR